MSRALVLIPCCKTKSVLFAHQALSHPLDGVLDLRSQLLQLIADTKDIADREENRNGILNEFASVSRALDLYSGNFYKIAGKHLSLCLGNSLQSVSILIVSALYGIVRLYEVLKTYDLTMTDRLNNGMRVGEYWRTMKLSQLVNKYVFQNSITHIWSLLPDSPKYPYQQIFYELWASSKQLKLNCYHVRVPNAGSGTGIKRAEWLKEVLNENPNYLVAEPFPPCQFVHIPGFTYCYSAC